VVFVRVFVVCGEKNLEKKNLTYFCVCLGVTHLAIGHIFDQLLYPNSSPHTKNPPTSRRDCLLRYCAEKTWVSKGRGPPKAGMPPIVKTLLETLLTALDCTKRNPEASFASSQASEAQQPIMPKGVGSADPKHCGPSVTIASPGGSRAGEDLRVSIPTPEEMRARPRNACGRPRSDRKTSVYVYGRAERASSPPKPYRVLSRTDRGGAPLHAARAEGMDLPPMPMPGGMPSPGGAMPGGIGRIPMPGGMPVPKGDLPDDDGGAPAANGRPGPPPLPGRRCGSFSEESESVSMETPHACDGTGPYSKSAYDQAFWSAAAPGSNPNPNSNPKLPPTLTRSAAAADRLEEQLAQSRMRCGSQPVQPARAAKPTTF